LTAEIEKSTPAGQSTKAANTGAVFGSDIDRFFAAAGASRIEGSAAIASKPGAGQIRRGGMRHRISLSPARHKCVISAAQTSSTTGPGGVSRIGRRPPQHTGEKHE
jgi:hypothetical protein